jgi:hypothetical protein
VNTTDTLLRQARTALDGKHPEHGFPIQDGHHNATAYALVALATEQKATNWHLASIAHSLTRIADALQAPAPTVQPEPRRRGWPFTRRNA